MPTGETKDPNIYTSPPICCRPQRRQRHLLLYLVRVPTEDSDLITGIGVTVQNEQMENIAHEDFVVEMGGSADEPMNTLIHWLTNLGFSIEIDERLLHVFSAFTSLVKRVRRVDDSPEITDDDYVIPPSADTFVDELRPVTTSAAIQTQPAC